MAQNGSGHALMMHEMHECEEDPEGSDVCLDTEEHLEVDAVPIDLDEDVYALAISDLALDFQSWEGMGLVQVLRLGSSLMTVGVCIWAQIFLCLEVKKYVTSRNVHDIRLGYDAFELHMYGNDPTHTYLTVHGHHRGLEQFFNASLFDTLTHVQQEAACHIPLSEPWFCACVLWIWVVVCAGRFSRLSQLFVSLIIRTKTGERNQFIFKRDRMDQRAEPEAESGTRIIYQLTLPTKCIFTVFTMIPRLVVLTVLLWLGLRWLLSTTHFSDILLNAIGLDFILEFPYIFFLALVPNRNKHDLRITKVLPPAQSYGLDVWNGAFVGVVNIVVVSFVYLYMMHLQDVLPDYKYDVHAVCQQWFRINYMV